MRLAKIALVQGPTFGTEKVIPSPPLNIHRTHALIVVNSVILHEIALGMEHHLNFLNPPPAILAAHLEIPQAILLVSLVVLNILFVLEFPEMILVTSLIIPDILDLR